MKTVAERHVDAAAWDRLLGADPWATFFHRTVWLDSLHAVYPYYRPLYLLALDATGAVAGGLPVMESRRFGLTQLLSLPYGTYGGPVAAGSSASERRAVRGMLLEAWGRAVRRPGVVRAHLVSFRPSPGEEDAGGLPGFTAVPERTHLLDLGGGFDHVWSRSFGGDKRTECRKATRFGVRAAEESTAAGARAMEGLYRAQAPQWRNHTAFPPGLFAELLSRAPGDARIWMARLNGEPVAADMVLAGNSTALVWLALTTPEARRTGAGNLLYSAIIEDACSRGFQQLNFGGSRGAASLEAFKSGFGAQAVTYPTWLHEAPWFRPLHRLQYRLRGIHDPVR